jgi:trehalose 6-phosphate phosphatase
MRELGDDYRLIAGKMVFEITPVGHDKGEAVHTLMARSPFSGRSALFVGDDVTDEDGFRAANALNGTSILVGTRDDSEARFALADVAAVHKWLEDGIGD